MHVSDFIYWSFSYYMFYDREQMKVQLVQNFKYYGAFSNSK